MSPFSKGLALQYLRSRRDLGRPELTTLLGWAYASLVGRYERGEEELGEELLREIARALGYPPEAVDLFLFAEAMIARPPRPEAPSPVSLGEEERRQLSRTILAAVWTLADLLFERLALVRREAKVERAYCEAEELLERLLPLSPAERRAAVVALPELRHWALAVRLCRASVEAAADKADKALELADLAGWVAARVDETPGFRLRLEGYCLLHLGNARRVANDFDGADRAFAQGYECWRTGTDAEPPLLPEWHLLSLEASLRRAQHRFDAALELIDRAREGCGDDGAAVARLLLKKEHVFQMMGDIEGALAVLAEAAPFVEGSGEPRLLSVLRFNTADNLCRLGRYAAAAELLPQVRELITAQGKDLDRVRVLWLEGRVQSGLGQRLDAQAALEKVQRYFTGVKLAYDAALSGLDLALLWLEMGRTAAVRELAAGMAWIFTASKIEQEALAALNLFCEAAKGDVATLDLTRQVIADVERVRRGLPPQGKRTRGGRGRRKS